MQQGPSDEKKTFDTEIGSKTFWFTIALLSAGVIIYMYSVYATKEIKINDIIIPALAITAATAIFIIDMLKKSKK